MLTNPLKVFVIWQKSLKVISKFLSLSLIKFISY